MYFDLNVPYNEVRQHDLREVLRESVSRGFQVVALNREVTEMEAANRVPSPVQLGPSDEVKPVPPASTQLLLPPEYQQKGMLTQLKRLTLVTDLEAVAGLLAPGHSLRKGLGYDVVAIKTTSSQVLKRACSALDVDLVVLEPPESGAKRVSLTAADYKAAIARGIHFEICYGPLKRNADPHDRANFMAWARYHVRSLKGRHIVLSSGATDSSMLCSPLEVKSVALACLGFGSEPGVQGGDAKAAAAVRANPQAVIEKAAEARRGNIRIIEMAVQVTSPDV